MTDPISNERLVEALDNLRVHQRQLDADGCEVGVSREALNEVIRAFGEQSRRQSPAGADPVAWQCFDCIMEQWSVIDDAELAAARSQRDGEWIVRPLYASPTKAVTISDEMRQAIRVLKLIADGYSAKGDGLGEFVQVENPDYRPDNGSDPYIVVDIAALSSEAHNG